MRVLFALILVSLLSACVQSPTHSTLSVDDRPGLIFELLSPKLENHELKVDGVSYGKVGQYKKDKARLKIISGNHLVQIFNQGTLVYEEKVYLGAGVDRILKVAVHD